MATIGIDLRCIPADGSAGAGVAHAARFLTEALMKQDVPWTWRVYAPDGADVAPVAPTVALESAEGSALRASLKYAPCDIMLALSGAVPPRLAIPVVPWVHDAAIFDHPEWFSQRFLKRAVTTGLFRWGLTHAPHVLAVSHHTKQELIRLFRLAPSSIDVTHEGGDPVLASASADDVLRRKAAAQTRVISKGISGPFVLALGTAEPRKNLSLLREACAGIPLVIAGKDGWGMEEIPASAQVHRVKDVDESFKRDLLLSADIIAVPSLHEGFGLVALEAMQAGTAVVCSNAGALPEVVGDAGILLDPHDLNAWKETLHRVMRDRSEREEWGRRGKERSRQFSWEKTAQEVCRVFKMNLASRISS